MLQQMTRYKPGLFILQHTSLNLQKHRTGISIYVFAGWGSVDFAPHGDWQAFVLATVVFAIVAKTLHSIHIQCSIIVHL